MKTVSLMLMAALCTGTAFAVPPAASVSLTQDPLIMRVSQDEFRIAFGLNGERCGEAGCSGVIHYRVDWKGADGALQSETRRVSYVVSPRAARTIAVDRQYFHSAEGRDTTDIVRVRVAGITVR